jgi:hypothetical protein
MTDGEFVCSQYAKFLQKQGQRVTIQYEGRGWAKVTKHNGRAKATSIMRTPQMREQMKGQRI